MIRDYDSLIVSSEEISKGIWHMKLECPQIASSALPGNFVLLSPSKTSTPLLRRPFGVLSADEDAGTFEVLYRVVGSGTKLISDISAGEKISVRGPVGGAFGKSAHSATIAVAGTLGVVPLMFLRERAGAFAKMCLGVGNSSWKDFADWVISRVPETELYSDDGSLGKKGFSIAGLEGLDLSDVSIVCCGPNPMMKAAYLTYGSACDDIQVSLEKRMGCGMGGCYGCVIDTTTGRRRVCIDGPVFKAEEVDWNALHL